MAEALGGVGGGGGGAKVCSQIKDVRSRSECQVVSTWALSVKILNILLEAVLRNIWEMAHGVKC